MKPLRAVFPLVLLCFLAITTVPSQAQDVVGDLLGRINGLRSSLGLAPYTLNGSLNAAAQDHAQWMATALSISHTRPDGSTPTTRAASAGYPSSFVSENIYGGTMAGVNDAWNFWLNSPIHYRGMTNAGYTEIGIGHAVGEWRTFVLVFGSQSSPYIPQSSGGGSGNSGGGRASAPPSFVVGVDNYGNIMHEIQPGQDLGQIALIYGYTWDDIPDMLELNNMTSENIRLLPVGGIFLVPPWEGTYTPTPLPPGVTLTATPDAPTGTPVDDLGIVNVPGVPTISLMEQFNQTSTAMAEATQAAGGGATATPTGEINAVVPPRIVTSSAELPVALAASSPTPQATLVAMVDNGDPDARVVVVRESQTSPWMVMAVVVQTLVVAAAAFEFGRRIKRK